MLLHNNNLYKQAGVKTYTYIAVFFSIAGILCAYSKGQGTPHAVYQTLLQYRLEHDRNYRQLHMQADITHNNLQKAKTKSVVQTEVGSGNTQLILNTDKDKGSFATAPYVQVRMPSYNNTSVKVAAPYSKMGQQQEAGTEVSVSIDIYSKNAAEYKYTVSLAQAEADSARRAQEEGSVLAEKQLLKDIQKLLDDYTAALDKELNAVKADIQYKHIKSQGYAENSIKLRTANLELVAAQREHRQAVFNFTASYRMFAESCGVDEAEKPDVLLPSLWASLPIEKTVSIENYSPEAYKSLVEAQEQHAQNAVKRDITLSPVSIGADAGYKLHNTRIGNEFAKLEHAVLGGLGMQFPGGKAYIGAEVPLSEPTNTALKLSFSFDPFALKYRKLDKRNAELEDAIEKLKIEDAKEQYKKQLHAYKMRQEQLTWQQTATVDELSIYKQNADDHAQWYQAGIISKVECLQAELEYKKADVRSARAKIDVMIFNIDTALLFQK